MPPPQKPVLPSGTDLTYYNHGQTVLAKVLEMESVGATATPTVILAGGCLVSSLLPFGRWDCIDRI